MSIPRDIEPWTAEQFFAWQASQDERYELVGGIPDEDDERRGAAT